jgi:hypothetical protein
VLSPQGFLDAAQLVDAFAALNYSKHKHLDARCVQDVLESKGFLVPVTTEAPCQDRERLPPVTKVAKSSAVITRQLPETG